jgi:hypothetical protein
MAKISAGGDREVHRWRKRGGMVMVLTERGRLLEKLGPRERYRVRRPLGGDKRWSPGRAGAQAAMLGYTVVEPRSSGLSQEWTL